MGNAWVSHQYFIAQDNARMGRNREIGTRTFPIVCVLFSHLIPILWYTSLHGKCMAFRINFS